MAPIPPAVYFPSLDKCLARELPLVSWESAYRTVSAIESSDAHSSPALDAFFADDTVLEILSAPLSPFGTPTPQSKTDYETRTAAINATPSTDGQYDLKQIKTDALWLSKEAGIEESQALRIVLVEWQQSSAARLLAEWSEDERLGVQSATANANFRQSVHPFAQQDKDNSPDYDDEAPRHARLLNLVYSETSYLLALSALLIGIAQSPDYQPVSQDITIRRSLRHAAEHVWAAQHSDDTFFVQCSDTLRAKLEILGDSSKWSSVASQDEEVAHAFVKSIYTQFVPILRLAFLHVFARKAISDARTVTSWYYLMDEYAFLLALPDFPETQDLVIVIRCLTSLISVEVLKSNFINRLVDPPTDNPNQTIDPEQIHDSYLADEECIRTVSGVLLNAAQAPEGIRHAGPPILTWGIVGSFCMFHATRQSEDKGYLPPGPILNRLLRCYEIIMETECESENPLTAMATAAVDGLETFEMVTSLSECLLLAFGSWLDLHVAACGKMTLYQMLRSGYPLFQYSPDLVQALLSVLSYDKVPPSLSRTRSRNPFQPVKMLLEEKDSMGAIFFEQIQQRYPYELRPFLNILLSISQSRASADDGEHSQVLNILENMTTFTHVLPQIYVERKLYENYREDELQNHIRLLSDVPIVAPRNPRVRQLLLTSADQPQIDAFIPENTVGIVLNSQQKPLVVCWHHEHSALEHMGLLLSTRLSNASLADSITGVPLEKEAAAEIIALTDSLIHASMRADDINSAKHVLGRLSYRLDRNDDIVRVIFQIFEEELHAQVDQPGAEGSLYLLVHCVRLMQTLLSLYPERIWSLLTRSRLLSVDDNLGGLAAVISTTELPLGQYDLLRACIGLYEGLIEDAITRAVSRNVNNKAVTRFDDPAEASGTTPEKLMSAVLVGLQRVLLDVLQSAPSWRFVFPSERCEINARILNAEIEILKQAYSVDDNPKVTAKLTGVFAQPSDDLVKTFLAETPHALTFHPILNIFMSALASVNPEPFENEGPVRQQTCAALSFCSAVLNVGLLLEKRGTYLAQNLLQSMPLLARLFAAQHFYKAPIATLLTSIVRIVNYSDAEPASLLGHLSPEAAKCFLAVLSELDHPIRDIDSEATIWDMLSAVVSNKQQWLAICLLTGSTPREKLKGTARFNVRGKALLTFALDQLSDIPAVSPKLAISMLRFVSLAQDNWAWATSGIAKQHTFLRSASDWLVEIESSRGSSDMETDTRAANETQIAAYAADILAHYLRNIRQLGDDKSPAKSVATKLGFLRDHGASVNAYNHSLHKSLAKNFTSKFPQCTLENFKRTSMLSEEYGREYYYDCKTAGRMLDFNPSWNGRNNQGFVNELARANVNLSLVEAQVNLLKSWKSLAITLGTFAGEIPSLQNDLATVVLNCLLANMEASIPSLLFDNVAQLRADMAFVLLQQLTLIRSTEAGVRNLLTVAWDAVRTSTQDFEVASTQRDIEHYRTLLRILFLALQPQIYNPVPTTDKRSRAPVAPTLPLEILGVVHKNFRSLCANLHANSEPVEASDFALLIALLQSILKVPGISSAHPTIAAIFAEAGTVRYATSLYTWSDKLEVGDPIFGELSILLLLELSSVPLIADQMAVEGVLSSISSAKRSEALRNVVGKGPFDEPIRMFRIWSKGLLPLCLNILQAVGPSIAGEISSFLNNFPAQLRRAETDLENRQPTLRQPYAGCITLDLASETHTLALISLVLEHLKAVGANAGVVPTEVPDLIFDRTAVREQVEGLLRSRRVLRERMMPIGDRESEWARQSPQSSQEAENRLEEKVVSEFEAAMVCLTG